MRAGPFGTDRDERGGWKGRERRLWNQSGARSSVRAPFRERCKPSELYSSYYPRIHFISRENESSSACERFFRSSSSSLIESDHRTSVSSSSFIIIIVVIVIVIIVLSRLRSLRFLPFCDYVSYSSKRMSPRRKAQRAALEASRGRGRRVLL